jgi:hypothetical protein
MNFLPTTSLDSVHVSRNQSQHSTTPLVKNERVKSRRPTAHASRFVPVQKLGSDGDVRAHPDDKTPLISTSTSSGSHQPEIACPLAPWWLAPDGAPDADA